MVLNELLIYPLENGHIYCYYIRNLDYSNPKPIWGLSTRYWLDSFVIPYMSLLMQYFKVHMYILQITTEESIQSSTHDSDSVALLTDVLAALEAYLGEALKFIHKAIK